MNRLTIKLCLFLLMTVNTSMSLAVELAAVEDSSPEAQIMPQKDVPRIVKSLRAKVEGDTTVISILLNQQIGEENFTLENHETFLQLVLPRTLVAEPGKFIEVQTPYVSKLVGFQSKAETASLRFFVSEDSLNIKKSTSVTVRDNTITLRIDHKMYEEMAKTDPTLTAQTKHSLTAQETIDKVKIAASIPEPAAKISAIENSKDAAGVKEIAKEDAAGLTFLSGDSAKKMYDRLFKAGIFCAVMLIGLLGFYVWRPRFKRFRELPDNYSSVQMKTLAKHTISAKQRLELIDVGGEKILIAISPDQVQFLTNIQQHRAELPTSVQAQQQLVLNQAPSRPTNRLPQANPQVEAAKTIGANSLRPLARAAATTGNPVASRSSQPAPTPTRRRIETRVGDDIKMDYSKNQPIKKPQDNQTISDVTRLIREKLKNLPSV